MKKHLKISFLTVAGSLVVLCLLVVGTVHATPVSLKRTAVNVDWCSAGISGTGGGSGTINLNCVTGNVQKAFLYWHGINNGGAGAVYDNANIQINGTSITGTSLGDATTNCWGSGSSRAFEADVTSLVPGNGAYVITGLSALPNHNSNGASLVVVFDDGDNTNNRDLVFFTGNDSNFPEGFPGEDDGWHASLSGINYGGGPVAVQIHLADGQIFLDEGRDDNILVFSTVNGMHTILDDPPFCDGHSLPSAGTSRATNGELWDIHTFDITPAFGATPGTVTLGVDGNDPNVDCLGLSVLLLDLEPFSAPVEISLQPKTDFNCTGEDHTVVATIKDTDGVPQEGIDVSFEITSGPNVGKVGTISTDTNGEASWTYADEALVAGTDEIEACFTDDTAEQCDTATKDWEVCNEPPDCSGAQPSISCIWPPNHMFLDVGVVGVTDPDGDPVTITITGITSDEATATEYGAGGATHAPDGTGVGTDTASLRSERSGLGNGRVYVLHFEADDGNGGTCEGTVPVQVPHHLDHKICDAIDDGQNYDATQ